MFVVRLFVLRMSAGLLGIAMAFLSFWIISWD